MSRHLHFYFSQWSNESRAWRAGALAIDEGYATTVDYIGYKGKDLPNQQPLDKHQRILRLGAEPAPVGSSRIKRGLSLPRWWKACLREAQVEDASLIVAHSLAALPMAVHVARKYKLPLLYDAHELETERAGWVKPIRMMAKALEARMIRKCDHVVLVNESIREWYVAAYPGIETSVVRNVPVARSCIGESSLRKSLGLSKDVMVFVYCGAFGKGRGLPELIEVFQDLSTERHLVLVGYGASRDALIEQAEGLANVHFHDAVSQSELITLISGADVGVVVLRTDALSYEYALPNKVFEYAAAGLGVIVGQGPELEKFAREYSATRFSELNVKSLREAVMAWSRSELDAMNTEITAYEVPTWQKEQSKLTAAFDRALSHGQKRWSRHLGQY